MSKEIYIVGASGLAHEVYLLINQINENVTGEKWEFKGFVDVDPKDATMLLGGNELKIISEEEFLKRFKNSRDKIYVTIGIGNSMIRENVWEKFGNSFVYPNLIHPSFCGNKSFYSLGIGNIITANCIFTTSVLVGDFNVFNWATTVGHDVSIGNFNMINPCVNISGGVRIGNSNLLGVNSSILQYLSIGSNSVIGAGSIVTKDVDSNIVVVGVPAKKIKKLDIE